MTPQGKLIVHTDVILDYVLHPGQEEHYLRRAMRAYFCYVTVFTAIELFSVAETEAQQAAIEGSVSAMKILGLNAKHARRYGQWLASGATLPRMNGLIACMSLESKVPILTSRPGEFEGMKGLKLISPAAIE